MNITVAVASRRAARIICFVFATLFGSGAFNAALAGPEGENVIRGRGSVARPDAHTTNVTQHTARLVIDWQTFNVAANETVNFLQPSADAAVLNRILDQNPSQIFGAINANGRVLLINPHGFLFGETASINVGALLASSLSMDPDEFMNGDWRLFAADPETLGSVINHGLIHAADAGFVGLLGGAVSNEGVIVANYGEVVLGAGTEATVDFDGDGLIRFRVDGELQTNLEERAAAVSNIGSISAAEGLVILTADTATEVFSQAVNNGGLIAATGIQNDGGRVYLAGGRGDAVSTGVIDVSSASANGGRVEVTGNRVGLFGDSVTDASGATGGGTVLVGGDYQGTGETDTAEFTVVSSNSIIDVSATGSGDGGKAIFWADDSTWFRGTVFSLGGSEAGNGGFVEISGKEGLVFTGHADLSAVNGELGSLLFDPDDISIVAGTAGTGADDGEIGGADGEITFASPAAGSLVITDGQLNTITADITLQANNSITAASGVSVTADSSGSGRDIILQTTSGDITLTGATFATQGSGSIDINAGGNVFTGTLTAANGDISITAGAGVTVDGDISTNSSSTTAISIDNTAITATTLQGSGNISAVNGTVSLDYSNISLTGTLSTPHLYIDSITASIQTDSSIEFVAGSQVTTLDISGTGTGISLTDADSVTFNTLRINIDGDLILDGDGTTGSRVANLQGLNASGADVENVLLLYPTSSTTSLNITGFDVGNNLTVTSPRTIGGSGVTVGGLATFNSGEWLVNFSTGTNDFNQVNVARADRGTSITETNGFEITGIDTGALTLSVASGTVTDSGSIDVRVIAVGSGTDGNMNLNSGADYILDNNVDVQREINTAATVGNVYIDAFGGMTLGNILNTGTLTLESADSIRQATTASGYSFNGVINGPGNITVIDKGSEDYHMAVNFSNTSNDIQQITIASAASPARSANILDSIDGMTINGIYTEQAATLTNSTGAILTPGELQVGGLFTVNSNLEDSNLYLTNTGNSFTGGIDVNSSGGLNDLSVTSTSAVQFASMDIGGDLVVTAGGTINQAAASVITVAGTSTFDADTGNVVLGLLNDFNIVHVNDGSGGSGAASVFLTDTNGFQAGDIIATDQVSLTVNGTGNLTQASTDGIVADLLTLSLGSTNNAVLTGSNDVDRLTLTSGNSIQFTDTDGLQLQSTGSAIGSVDINAGGLVDQLGGSTLQVTGLMDVNAGTADITLTESTNSFGSLNVTGGTVAVRESNGISVQGASTASLSLTAAGTIVQTGGITTTTGLTLNAGGANAVTLDDNSNSIAGPIAASSISSLSLTSNGDIDLGAITTSGAAGNLDISSIGGNISDSGTLTITGTADFTVQSNGDVIIDSPANSFTGGVSVILSGAGSINDVHIVDNDVTALNLAGMTLSGDLTVNGAQGVNQSGAWILTNVNSVANIQSNNNITLGLANDFQELRISGATVGVNDINGLTLGATTATNGLTVTANNGSIGSNDTITVTGTAQFNLGGTNVDLTLGNGSNVFNNAVNVSLLAASSLNDVTLVDTTALQLPAMTLGGDLDVNAAGITQAGALVVGGLTTLESGTNDIVLGNNSNDFQGNVYIKIADDVTIKDLNDLSLGNTVSGNSDINGNLVATSGGGDILDGGIVDVAGTTTLIVETVGQNIVLDNDHVFGGNINFTGSSAIGNLEINDTSGGLVLGSGISASNLTLTAAGTISSAFSTTVTGLADITVEGGTGLIQFNNNLNNFNQVSLASNDPAVSSLIKDMNSLQLAVVDLAGDLIVQVSAPVTTVTQTAAGSVLVDGLFRVDAANSTVTLDNAANDFGQFRVAAISADIVDTDALEVTQATLTGAGTALDLTTGGDLNQSGLIQVANGTTLLDVTGDLTWNNATNNFNQVELTSVTGSATIRDMNAITLGNVDIDGASFTLNAGGTVTQTAASSVLVNAVGATTQINAAGQAVTLDNTGNDFQVIGVNAAATTLRDANGLDFAASTITGDLTVNALGGNITDSGIITANTGGTTASFTATGDVILNNANDILNLSANAANLTYNDTNGINLAGITLTGNAIITSNGIISDSGTLDINGTTSLTAGSGNDIVLDLLSNDFTGAVSVVSGDNVTIKDTNDLDIGGADVSGSLVLFSSTGNISDSGVIDVAGATTLGVGTSNRNAILDQDNLLTGNLLLGATSFGILQVNDTQGGLVLGSGLSAANLTLDANGAITSTFATTVTGLADINVNGGAGNITFTNTGNNFNQLSLSSADAAVTSTINESNNLQLAGIDLDGNLTIIQGAAATTLTQTAAAALIDGQLFINSPTVAVTLSNNNNDFGSLRLTAVSANIDDLDDLTVASSTLTGAGAALDITTGGDLAQSAGVVAASGTTTLGVTGNLNWNDAGNNFNQLDLDVSGTATVRDAGAITLGNVDIDGASFTLNVGGAVTQTATSSVLVNAAGATMQINAAGQAVTLDNSGNDFQVIGVNAAATTLRDANGLDFAASTITGDLTVNALAGNITDSGAIIADTATTSASLNASGNILLDEDNDFLDVSANAVNLTLNDMDAINFNGVNLTGNLVVTAAGDISDTGVFDVDGTSSFTAGAANDISLDNIANDFTGAVTIVSSNNVTIMDAGNLDMGASDVDGNLVLFSIAGDISDSGIIDVAGTTTLGVGTADSNVVLDQDNLFAGNVLFTGSQDFGNLVLNDTSGGLILGSSVAATSLTVNAAGSISSTFTTSVSGLADITVEGGIGNISFSNAANDFNRLSIDASDASVASAINETNNLQLAVVDIAGDLAIVQGATAATLTQTAAGSVIVDGELHINAPTVAVALDNPANDFGSIKLSTVTADIQDVDDLIMAVSTMTGSGTALDITTGGDLTQSGAILAASGTTILDVTGSLNWNNAGNDFKQLDLAQVTGSATVRDLGAITLGNVDVDGASFTLTAAGAVDQAAGTTVLVNTAGAVTTINATGQAVSLDNTGNDFTTIGVTAASATLRDSGAVDLGASTIAGTLTVNSGGHVTDSNNISAATLQLNLTTTADATLNSTGNDFDTVNVSNGHDLVLADNDDLNLGTLNLAGLANIGSVGDLAASAITVGSGSALTLNSTGGGIIVNGALTASGAGNVSLQSDAGLLDINAAVDAGTGAVDLDGLGVDFAATADITAGSITVDANGIGNDIFMADGAVIDTTAGTGGITLVADDQVTLGQLLAGGDASVTATNGGIADGTAAESVNVSAGRITLLASTGIGSADDIDTNATATTGRSLDVQLTAAGNIAISETDQAQLFAVADDGDIEVNASGNIYIDQLVANGTGNTISLATSGGTSIQDMQDDNTVDVNADNISLNAGTGDIGGAALNGSAVDADGLVELDGDMTLAGNNVSVGDSGSGASRTLTVAAGGDFAFSFANDIFIDDVSADGNVTLISTGGNIFDLDDDAVTDITSGGTVDLRAAVAIGGEVFGSASPADGNIEIDAAAIKADAGGGDILLSLAGATTLQDIDAAAGDIVISSAGTLEIDSVAASGDVSLETDGSIEDANAVQSLIEGGIVSLEAATGIGSSTSTDRIATSADTLHLTTAAGVIGIEETDAVILGTVANNGGAVHLSSAGQMSIGMDITTTGMALEISAPILLTADVTLATGGGSVDVGGLVTGAGNDLAISSGAGDVTLSSGVTGMDTFTRNGSGGFVIGGDVVANTVDINSAVSLDAGVDLTANIGGIDISGDLAISGSGTESVLQSLNDADISIGGAITVVGGNRSLSLNSEGDVSLAGSVSLGTGALSATVDSDADGVATFSSSDVDAAAVTLAGNGSNDIFDIGNLTADGNISLSDGGTISDGASIESSSGNIVLEGSYAVGDLSLTGQAVTVIGDLTSAADGDVSISNAAALVLNGDLNLGGSLTQAGGGDVSLSGNITTSGDAVSFDSNVNLSAGDHSISTGTGAGSISLAGTVTGAGDNLSLMAGTGEISLASVSAISNLGLSGTNLTTSGDIVVDAMNMNGMSGDLFIAGDSSFVSSDTNIDFTVFGNINELSGGNSNLVVDAGSANADFSGVDIGQVNALDGFDVTAATVNLNNVTTIGDQSYTGNLEISGTLDGGTLAMTGDVTLAGDASWQADADILIDGSVDGASSLTAVAGGNIDFNGGIGLNQELAALNLTAAESSVQDVTTAGAQTYSGSTSIAGALSGSALEFNGALQVEGDSTLISDAVALNGGASSVSGSSELTIAPATQGHDIVLSSSSGNSNDSLVLNATALDGFSGGLIIGGIEADGNPDIFASTISVESGIDTGAGRLALYSMENIDLAAGTLAAGELYLVVSGSEGTITNSGGSETLLESDLIVLVAAEAIGEEGQYLEAKSESGNGTMLVGTSSSQAFVNNFNNQLAVEVNFASDLILKFAEHLQINLSDETQLLGSAQSSAGREQGGGLADEGFIDSSLFQEIALFESSGSGIALPGDQSEEAPADCEDKDARAECGGDLKPYPMPARDLTSSGRDRISAGAPN